MGGGLGGAYALKRTGSAGRGTKRERALKSSSDYKRGGRTGEGFNANRLRTSRSVENKKGDLVTGGV